MPSAPVRARGSIRSRLRAVHPSSEACRPPIALGEGDLRQDTHLENYVEPVLDLIEAQGELRRYDLLEARPELVLDLDRVPLDRQVLGHERRRLDVGERVAPLGVVLNQLEGPVPDLGHLPPILLIER